MSCNITHLPEPSPTTDVPDEGRDVQDGGHQSHGVDTREQVAERGHPGQEAGASGVEAMGLEPKNVAATWSLGAAPTTVPAVAAAAASIAVVRWAAMLWCPRANCGLIGAVAACTRPPCACAVLIFDCSAAAASAACGWVTAITCCLRGRCCYGCLA